MNRPSSFEGRLDAYLEEGPTSGPDDLLTSAHARARSTRRRPAWLLALRGTPMDTTWRARPLPVGAGWRSSCSPCGGPGAVRRADLTPSASRVI